ncbi:MAG: ABC transporter permease [Acidobacteria bacterium]|nr:ABC transporter permease [Acidobacteriota bacterium]
MRAMLILEMVRVAGSAIWANKLRSFLTILGNIVAITSIITLVSLIQGITDEVRTVILSEIGADAFLVDRRGLVMSEEDLERTRSHPRITLADADAVRRFGTSVTAVMAEADRNAEVRYREHVLDSVNVRGVTEEFGRFPTFNAATGRLLTPTEVRRKRNVAVIGWAVADRLFPAVDPVDRTIKIRGVPFRVVGVSRPQGSMFGMSQDEFAIVPLGAFQRLFGSRSSLNLRIRPRDPDEVDAAIGETTLALRIERRLKATEEDNFGILTSDTALGLFNQATAGIFAVLVGVVGLALVVAGIVIMNIMLMAVSERTKEIGLRKALGARRQDILNQMLAESVVLSLMGGIAGTALGAAAALLLDRFAPVPASVQPWSVILAITLTAVVGLFFGLYPAARAAALDPIDALGRSD